MMSIRISSQVGGAAEVLPGPWRVRGGRWGRQRGLPTAQRGLSAPNTTGRPAAAPPSAARKGRPLNPPAELPVDSPNPDLQVQAPRRVKRLLRTPLNASSVGQVDYESRNLEELHMLVQLLPEHLHAALTKHPDFTTLVEVVLDVGRPPVARYPSGDVKLTKDKVTYDDIDRAVTQAGDFGGDNRAGINRCLHRISCMRNRAGRIIALTCRVGRAVPGTAELIGDIVREGHSVLLLGSPGVGKTTALRDICRLLSDECLKRVIAVDTSNEIGGDGDIPHHAIGRSRRLQVPSPEEQHAVMIEAVENHMPEVIVIDEIGTEAEALAARTIGERGVQLVATCHGSQLENVVKNPSLNELLGGLGVVTLGDEGARMRGGQKTVLERKGPPTFSIVVEMTQRNQWVVHHDAGRAVDLLLAGKRAQGEVRELHEDGAVTMTERWKAEEDAMLRLMEQQQASAVALEPPSPMEALAEMNDVTEADFGREIDDDAIRLYCLGIEEPDLLGAANSMDMGPKVSISDSLDDADAVITTRSNIKANGWVRTASASAGVPIFSLRSASENSIVRALRQLLGIDPSPGGAAVRRDATETLASDPLLVASQREPGALPSSRLAWPGLGPGAGAAVNMKDKEEAEEEARVAIRQIVIPNNQPIELRPRVPDIVELQVAVVLQEFKEFGLQYECVDSGSDSRLRILPAATSKSNIAMATR